MVTQQELRQQAELRQQGIQGTVQRQQTQALQKLETEEQLKIKQYQEQLDKQQQLKKSLSLKRKYGGNYVWEIKGKHGEKPTQEQIDYLKGQGYRMQESSGKIKFYRPRDTFGSGIYSTKIGEREYMVSSPEALTETQEAMKKGYGVVAAVGGGYEIIPAAEIRERERKAALVKEWEASGLIPKGVSYKPGEYSTYGIISTVPGVTAPSGMYYLEPTFGEAEPQPTVGPEPIKVDIIAIRGQPPEGIKFKVGFQPVAEKEHKPVEPIPVKIVGTEEKPWNFLYTMKALQLIPQLGISAVALAAVKAIPELANVPLVKNELTRFKEDLEDVASEPYQEQYVSAVTRYNDFIEKAKKTGAITKNEKGEWQINDYDTYIEAQNQWKYINSLRYKPPKLSAGQIEQYNKIQAELEKLNSYKAEVRAAQRTKEWTEKAAAGFATPFKGPTVGLGFIGPPKILAGVGGYVAATMWGMGEELYYAGLSIPSKIKTMFVGGESPELYRAKRQIAIEAFTPTAWGSKLGEWVGAALGIKPPEPKLKIEEAAVGLGELTQGVVSYPTQAVISTAGLASIGLLKPEDIALKYKYESQLALITPAGVVPHQMPSIGRVMGAGIEAAAGAFVLGGAAQVIKSVGARMGLSVAARTAHLVGEKAVLLAITTTGGTLLLGTGKTAAGIIKTYFYVSMAGNIYDVTHEVKRGHFDEATLKSFQVVGSLAGFQAGQKFAKAIDTLYVYGTGLAKQVIIEPGKTLMREPATTQVQRLLKPGEEIWTWRRGAYERVLKPRPEELTKYGQAGEVYFRHAPATFRGEYIKVIPTLPEFAKATGWLSMFERQLAIKGVGKYDIKTSTYKYKGMEGGLAAVSSILAHPVKFAKAFTTTPTIADSLMVERLKVPKEYTNLPQSLTQKIMNDYATKGKLTAETKAELAPYKTLISYKMIEKAFYDENELSYKSPHAFKGKMTISYAFDEKGNQVPVIQYASTGTLQNRINNIVEMFTKKQIITKQDAAFVKSQFEMYKKYGEEYVLPKMHAAEHWKQVELNVPRLIELYPQFNRYLIEKYGSIENAKKVISTGAFWHDLAKRQEASGVNELTQHAESMYQVWKARLLPPEVQKAITPEIAEAIRGHTEMKVADYAMTVTGVKPSKTYLLRDALGLISPEMKLIATADRLDLIRYGINPNPKLMPLQISLAEFKAGVIKYQPQAELPAGLSMFKGMIKSKYGMLGPTPELTTYSISIPQVQPQFSTQEKQFKVGEEMLDIKRAVSYELPTKKQKPISPLVIPETPITPAYPTPYYYAAPSYAKITPYTYISPYQYPQLKYAAPYGYKAPSYQQIYYAPTPTYVAPYAAPSVSYLAVTPPYVPPPPTPPYTPPYRPPVIPIIPPIIPQLFEGQEPEIKAVKKEKKRIKAWIPFIMKKGKWKAVSQPIEKSKAIRMGEQITLTTLAARFKIVKSKQEIEGEERTYVPSPEKFRTFKIVRGRQIPLQYEWIEKKTHRLRPVSTWAPVQRARAQYGYKHAPYRKAIW